MSALDKLPACVVANIHAQDNIREDLLAIPRAEAEGWRVDFSRNGNDSWHNAASFHRDNVVVWQIVQRSAVTAVLRWRRAVLRDDGSYPPLHPEEVFITLKAALGWDT